MRFLLMLIWLCSSLAWAAPTKEQQAKALKLYEQAETYYRLLQYEQALALYQEAYLEAKEPSLLFNIAQCYRLLQRYEEAKSSYDLYLQDDPNSPYREACERFLEEVNEALAKKSSEPAQVPTPVKALTVDQPSRKGERVFASKAYLVPASLGGLGLLFGASALLVDRQLSRETDPNQTAALRSKRLGRALTADASFLLAGGLFIGITLNRLIERRPGEKQ
jgi:tetratricopeptide (TPR) repeat protein